MQGRRLTDRECEMAAALRRRGMTYGEIADSLGVCLQTALKRCRIARERGIECPEDVRREHSKAPSNEQLLRLLNSGASAKQIAERAGVARTTVYYWIHRALREMGRCDDMAGLTCRYGRWVMVQTAHGWYAERKGDGARVRFASSAATMSKELEGRFRHAVADYEGRSR